MEVPRNSHVTPGENNTADDLRPLETIMPLLRQMTRIELPFDDVAEQALICLDKIGNTRRARYAVEIEVCDGFAELPAGCDRVDAVLSAQGFGGDTGNAGSGAAGTFVTPLGQGLTRALGLVSTEADGHAFLTQGQLLPAGAADGFVQLPVQLLVQGRLLAADQLSGSRYRLPDGSAPIDLKQLGARYVDYTFRDGGLYVGRQPSAGELVRRAISLDAFSLGETPAGSYAPTVLRVFYRSTVCDERGYPLITPEEALACAHFTQAVEMRKKFFAKEATGDQVQLAQQLSDQHINQARVAPLASSNGLDRLLDAGKRLHRHFVNDDFYA